MFRPMLMAAASYEFIEIFFRFRYKILLEKMNAKETSYMANAEKWFWSSFQTKFYRNIYFFSPKLEIFHGSWKFSYGY